nr:MAG TPA: hypothetical protein [Caudoviricetes sp.]
MSYPSLVRGLKHGTKIQTHIKICVKITEKEERRP